VECVRDWGTALNPSFDWTFGPKPSKRKITQCYSKSFFHFSHLSWVSSILRVMYKIYLNNFKFVWPCIVKNFFIIKPIRCTNFTNLFWHETTCFGQFFCPSAGVYSLYTQQWYISYKFVDSFRAGPPGPARKLLSVLWINSWWWTEELSETCRVSCQNKFVKLMHLLGFII
jgi:hypothetical protein